MRRNSGGRDLAAGRDGLPKTKIGLKNSWIVAAIWLERRKVIYSNTILQKSKECSNNTPNKYPLYSGIPHSMRPTWEYKATISHLSRLNMALRWWALVRLLLAGSFEPTTDTHSY